MKRLAEVDAGRAQKVRRGQSEQHQSLPSSLIPTVPGIVHTLQLLLRNVIANEQRVTMAGNGKILDVYEASSKLAKFSFEPYWPEAKLKICITGAGGFIARWGGGNARGSARG